jgi:hypothetical protein
MSGLVWLFTGGLFGVGWAIDFFLIPQFVEEVREQEGRGGQNACLAIQQYYQNSTYPYTRPPFHCPCHLFAAQQEGFPSADGRDGVKPSL